MMMMKLLFLLILVLETPFLAIADQKLIEKTCNLATFEPSNLCLNVLLADPKSATADVKGLDIITVGALKNKGEQAIKLIKSSQKGAGSEPNLRYGLSRCNKIYSDMVDREVPGAIKGLNEGPPKNAASLTDETANRALKCGTSFGTGSEPGDLGKIVGVSQDLAHIARDISNKMQS